ncbi:MAG TPA: LemA family protein [Candidatus Pacearchaeota archaeon]|nr:LemA family protein [Candidatus Pacearchaeota archaeon]
MHPSIYPIIGIVIVIVFWIILAYNRLVRLRQRAKEAWADIDVQLKRRYDLIPNLLETVKGYAQHEKDVFDNVTRARASAVNAKTVNEQAQAENNLSQTLKSLFAVVENYPELKASQNFIALQQELADTENKIQAARRFYNTNVRDLNIRIESFPDNLMARLFKFNQMDLFELADAAERQAPKVSF